MNETSLRRLWTDLTPAQQQALQAFAARLGFRLAPANAQDMERLTLDQAYLPGIRFQRNVFWFDPAVATITDLTHDLGHALQLNPSARAKFNHPAGDMPNGETGAMVVQWAACRSVLPDYPLGEALDQEWYAFGGDQNGVAWDARLKRAEVDPNELPIYLLLQDLGVDLAEPTVVVIKAPDDQERPPRWLRRQMWARLEPFRGALTEARTRERPAPMALAA